MLNNIVGSRVVLRPLKSSDAERIRRSVFDKQIVKFARCTVPSSPEDVRAWLARARKDTRSGTAYWFGIEDNESRSLVGVIALHWIEHRSSNAEAGCWISRQYRRRGYTFEALQLVLEFAFRELRLHRVFAATMEPNTASIKLLRKAGFKPEGRSREAELVGRRRCDVLWYGLLKKEFRPGRNDVKRR